ncbi:hypothetical protein [Fluviicola sp.]|uniref:hypothetical protein n=1 Tax=Fluviicola sp. TaxID=1917219 RepID=UPI00282967E1|nr:hypothetical protein [Fluviicola sp.]MDR0801677.1 hypothetical protein [Fluviicola sp.]
MEFISLIFRLGVILAIFSFIWGILKFGFVLLRGGVPMSYPLGLALKTIQYLLIADVAILFCTDNPNGNLATSITTGLILLMYFVGKVQNMQLRSVMMIQIQGRTLSEAHKPKMGFEFGIVALAMAVFGFLLWNPNFAENKISSWFYSNIADIENTPIFGFIFKVIGFFFTITMLLRMVNALSILFSGKAFGKGPDNDDQNNPNQNPFNHFDDYEEVD